MVDVANPRKEADQLATAYRDLDAITLRTDNVMLWQLLVQLIPKRRPLRMRAVQAAEIDTPEPPCDTVFGELYHIHAAIHGPNKLLPVDALPTGPSVHEQAKPEADRSLHEQSKQRRVP
jgi:hypothetical protein